MPVIFFHAGFELFSGGFVGVDIFFVISGYLITSILIEDIENNRFSIISFYERRARRILPALFFIMLVCIPFAWMWMLPVQMKDFSQSFVAVSLFASNILFWRESGYFDAAAEEKPLLHTWSLAVEEQYYVVFPVFLFMAWRFGKHRVFWTIVVFAAISLALSEWAWRHKASANFYLAPTRAWELLAGSIAAFIEKKYGVRSNNLAALLGAAAIIYAIFAYSDTTPFPSIYALIPVLGTVLVILFGDKHTVVAKFLSNKLFVGIGLISYSAYLWHQPLFAFARIKLQEQPTEALMVWLIGCSLLCAIGTWHYIEQPFRNKNAVSSNKILFLTAALLSFMLISGVAGHLSNGFEFRFNEKQLTLLNWENYAIERPYREGDCFLRPEQRFTEFNAACTSGSNDTLIWGDSHAAALASGWMDNEAIDQLTASGCPPILGAHFYSRPHCRLINDSIAKKLEFSSYRRVILHANWSYYGQTVEGLAETLDLLQRYGVEEVVIIGGVPQFHPSLPKKMFRAGLYLNGVTDIAVSQNTIAQADALVRSLAKGRNVRFLQPLDLLCKNDSCRAAIETDGVFVPVTWDYGHLTQQGAVFISHHLLGELQKEPLGQ